MDQKEFKAPDEHSLRRMTVGSVTALLETLQEQRAAKVRVIDQEIAYYEKWLDKNTKVTGA